MAIIILLLISLSCGIRCPPEDMRDCMAWTPTQSNEHVSQPATAHWLRTA
ncbi:MAG: hypothetical protein R3C97_01420 [Geminicoccaceae bacterium]